MIPSLEEAYKEIAQLRAAHAETREAWLKQGEELVHWQQRAQQQDTEVERLRAENDSMKLSLPIHRGGYVEWGDEKWWSEAALQAAEAEAERLRAEVRQLEADKAVVLAAKYISPGDAAVKLGEAEERLRKVVEILRDYNRYEWERINAALAAAQPEGESHAPKR